MSRRSQTYAMMPVAYSPYISTPAQAMQHPYGLYLRAGAPQGAVDYYTFDQNPSPNEGASQYYYPPQSNKTVTEPEANAMLADLIKYNDKLEQILKNQQAVQNYKSPLVVLRDILLQHLR